MLWLLLSLILAIALAYHRAGLRTSTAAFAALLLAYGVLGGSVLGFGLTLLLFVGVFVPLSLPTLRQEWLTRPLLDRVLRRGLLPSTWQATADEGSWDRRLLAASASEMLAVPVPIDPATVDRLFEQLSPLLDQAAPAQLQGLIAGRLLAPSLSTAEGGLELQAGTLSALIQRLAYQQPSSRLPELIAGFDAASRLIAQQATADQQAVLRPRLADGGLRCVIATASYWASGDGLADQARVSRGLWKGKECIGLELRLDKLADDSAPLANEFLMLLQLRDPESMLGTASTEGAVLVRVPVQLLDIQAEAQRWRLRTHAGFVPLDHLIGGSAAVGRGYAQLRAAEAAGAALRIAAASGRRARQFEQERLRLRIRQFHRLQASTLPMAQAALGDQALDVLAIDSLRRLLARMLDQAPVSTHIADFALPLAASLAGHAGVQSPPAAAIDSLILQLNPAIPSALAAAATQPYGLALIQFDAALWPLLAEVATHKSHALLLALSDGRIADTRSGGRHAQRLARYRAALSFCADLQALYPSRATTLSTTAFSKLVMQTLALAALVQAQAEDASPRDQQPLVDAGALRCARAAESALSDYARSQTRWVLRLGLRLLLLPMGPRQAQVADDPQRLAAAFLRSAPAGHPRPPVPADAETTALEAALDDAAMAQKRLLQALDNGPISAASPLDQIAQALSLNLITADEADALRSALNLSEDWLRNYD